MKTNIWCPLTVFVLVQSACAAFAATEIVVDPTGAEAGSVRTLEEAFSNLTSDNTTILVRPGTYNLTATLNNNKKNLVLKSANATTGEIDAEHTILDGSGFKGRILNSTASLPTIDGFTFRDSDGGAVSLSGAGAFRIQNCVFEGNHVENAYGGAINSSLNSGSVVSNCLFRSNYSDNNDGASLSGGGAIFAQQAGEGSEWYMDVTDCVFTNNYAIGSKTAMGGAIYSVRCMNVARCQFFDNYSDSTVNSSQGGTLYLGAASTIRNCTFSQCNTASREPNKCYGRLITLGGGSDSTPHVIDGCAFGPIENIGGGYGLIYNGSGYRGEVIANSVFRDISIRQDMNILHFGGSLVGVMRNCLFANNQCMAMMSSGLTWTCENCTFIAPADGGTLTSASSGTFVNCLSNCAEPSGATLTTSLFAGTAAGCGFIRTGSDYRLALDSPAIDAGTELAWHAEAKDIGGRPRFVGTAVDLGAYERQADDPEAYFTRAVATETERTGDWVEAHIGIQAAIDAADDGDTILVKAGRYMLMKPINITNRRLTLIGEGIDRTIVDAQGASRCLVGIVNAAGYGFTVSGMTFTNGCAGDDLSDANYKACGGGLYLSCNQSNSRIALTACRVTGCRALAPLDATGNIPGSAYYCGAGLYADRYCTFTGCQFDDCIASNACGAAIAAASPLSPTGRSDSMVFSNCIISNCVNAGKSGSSGSFCAGLYAGNSPIWIEGTTFAQLRGGAEGDKYFIALRAGDKATVTNCVFQDCKASYMAVETGTGARVVDCVFENVSANGICNHKAIYDRCVFTNNDTVWFQNAPTDVRNSLFKGNATVFGAHTQSNQKALFANCTFVANKKSNQLFELGTGDNVSVTLKNCIVHDNAQGAYSAASKETQTVVYMNCLVDSYAKGVSYTAVGCTVGADPKFVDAANGDYRLRRSSPGVDKGCVLDWMATGADLDRNPRVVTNSKTLDADPGARPDIGCYENQEKMPGLILIFR